jgi:hypothetical protein
MSNLKVEKDKNTETVKRTEIETTPFIVVTTEEGSFGTLGKYRITEVYKTEKEAIKVLEPMTWDRILQMIALITNDLIEHSKTTKK